MAPLPGKAVALSCDSRPLPLSQHRSGVPQLFAQVVEAAYSGAFHSRRGGRRMCGKPAAGWQELTESALVGLADWRAAHPQATFAEMETEVDQRLNRLRVRMLEDLALASAAADWSAAGEDA